jgi:imidazolonepropionase-like amidohydrolase
MLTRRDALTALLSAPLLAAQNPSPQKSTAFTNLTVIDGTGATLADHTVIVKADRITSVAPSASALLPPGTHSINARGQFLIPGLCDCHAHVSYFKGSALPVLLANGVTSIRDMGGLLAELDGWRTETDHEIRPGPRIFRAGPMLNGKAFNEFQVPVADAAEARGAVRVLKSANVDFVKVHAAILREAYFGVQSECRKLGLPYVGHMPRAITPEEASDAGQLTLEHVGAFGDRFESAGVPASGVAAALEHFRRQAAPALFERFARNKTWFTPTLIASKAAIHMGDHKPDPRDKYVSASCKKITTELLARPSYQTFFTPDSVQRQERQYQQLLPLVNLMHQSGVGLLAGTDFAASIIYPGFSLHDELELLVTAGLTPMQSLFSATVNPARVLGQKDLGVIKPGNRADFVLLGANPLTNIRNTTKIQTVVSRGKRFDRLALDQILAAAAEEAQRT